MTASSLFTSGRFAIDPELRGTEFERIIQNLDVHFWKAFWNITEIEVLSVSMGPCEGPNLSQDGDTEAQRPTSGLCRVLRSGTAHEGNDWEGKGTPMNSPSPAPLLFPPTSL